MNSRFGFEVTTLTMKETHPAFRLFLILFAVLALVIASQSARAQSSTNTSSGTASTETPVLVQSEAIPSAYGAPPAFSRTRTSPTTTSYVLPPWSFLFAQIYEGDAFKHGPPDHLFTQEAEMGLPYRFGLAAETQW
jgi:hypothetical protein